MSRSRIWGPSLEDDIPAGHLIDEDELPPDHEAWDILYTMPVALPPDPYKDHEPALT